MEWRWLLLNDDICYGMNTTVIEWRRLLSHSMKTTVFSLLNTTLMHKMPIMWSNNAKCACIVSHTMSNIQTMPIVLLDNAIFDDGQCQICTPYQSCNQTMPNVQAKPFGWVKQCQICIQCQLCIQTMPYKHAIVMLFCNAICVSQTMPNMEWRRLLRNEDDCWGIKTTVIEWRQLLLNEDDCYWMKKTVI